MDTAPRKPVRFGVFELDRDRQELRRAGSRVKLQAQPFRLLALLVSRRDEIVTREEIQRTVWDADTHVDFEQGINACVRQVRQVLGDNADEPRYIQTLPRRGYRFVAPVEQVEPNGTARSAAPATTGSIVRVGLIAAPMLLVAIIVGGFLWFGGIDTPQERPSLVILPFEDLGAGQDEARLGDALTEELIAAMGRRYSHRLLVIARTSSMKYKATSKSIAEIAEELGADYLLEGSVRRQEGRIRITVQLIRAADESHVWANNYQRDLTNALDIQIEIGDLIARALELQLLPSMASESISASTDPAAYQAYLQGLQLISSPEEMSSFDAALSLFERAIELDPGFAPAYVASARAYNAKGPAPANRQAARQAISRALALDDALPGAHLTLATMRFYQDYDLEGARQEFQRAIELNPNYAEAHHAFAAYYSVTGRHAEAIASVQRARRIDPLSSMVNSDVGWYYYFARRFDAAIEHSQRTLELDPGFYWAELCIHLALLQKGELSTLVQRGRELVALRDPEAEELRDLQGPDLEAAARSLWRWRMKRMQWVAGRRYISPSDFAHLHMALGQRERALARLEQSFEERSGWVLPFLTVDPMFDPLRADPRFRDLQARISGVDFVAAN